MAASDGCAVAVRQLDVGSQRGLGVELVGAGRADVAAMRGDLDRQQRGGDNDSGENPEPDHQIPLIPHSREPTAPATRAARATDATISGWVIVAPQG